MSELDMQRTTDFENPDDLNLVQNGNPSEIKNPPTCEGCEYRDSLCANGYCLIAGGGVKHK